MINWHAHQTREQLRTATLLFITSLALAAAVAVGMVEL